MALRKAPNPDFRPAGRAPWGALGAVLAACALGVALLPIPVTIFGLLPAYRMHARFLVFYAPFACLLVLAYMHYVRDILARQILADILDPMQGYADYSRPSLWESFRRGVRRLRTAVLALLPAVLLIVSFYSVTRYTVRLGESIDRAVPQTQGRVVRREDVLREADIDGIPMFTELTFLYIVTFTAAMAAFALMALKEYAKNATGLSEQDLVLGGANGEEEPGQPPAD